MEQKQKGRHLLPILILVFIGIFLLNQITLYTSDDYTYHFFFKGEYPIAPLQKIESLSDLVTSQINHWTNLNGRFLAHTLVQLFMQVDKSVFNLFNSLAFLALGWLLASFASRLAEVSRPSPFILVSSYLYLWWCLPEFGKTALWLSGSINYLWSSLFYLSWFYAILFWKPRLKSGLPLILLGLLAGATNENTAPAIILSCGLYLGYLLLRKKEVNLSKWLSLGLAIFSFYLILSSPGSHHRASKTTTGLSTMFHSLMEVFKLQRYYLLVVYLLVAALFYFIYRREQLAREEALKLSMVLLAHLASTYVLIFSPETPGRVFFGPSLLVGLLIISQLSKLSPSKNGIPPLRLAFFSLLLATAVSYVFVFYDNFKSYRQVQHQYQMIQEAKAQGHRTVTIPMLSEAATLYNPYHTTANLGEGDEYWFNQWMAAYFGMDKIAGLKLENKKSHQE